MLVIVPVVLAAAALIGVVTALVSGGLYLASRQSALGPASRARNPQTLLRVGAWAAAGAVTCAVAFVLVLYGVPWS
jgi:hypothetical protein